MMNFEESVVARILSGSYISHFTLTLHLFLCQSQSQSQSLSFSLVLRSTVSRPIYLGIKHPSGAYDKIFITVRQLRVYWCDALSLTRGCVCRLQLLLALASAVILEFESLGTRDHILLSHIRDLPSRRLLWLRGLRWRYSTLPPHMFYYLRQTVYSSSNTMIQLPHLFVYVRAVSGEYTSAVA
jgi:hypothetical protein